MRPVKIEFQAFGSYAEHEIVDLEAISGRGLFLICGKTGIGKTMILDAMTFALYGGSSGGGRNDFEAMRCTNADKDTPTFVKFEFENNGDRYLFERRLEQKRIRLSPSYNVSKKGEDDVWYPLFENPKDRDLNKTAEEVIGLNYDQFRQVIVLPQGQFENFLSSRSSEKEKILTNIFGEEKWQTIAELLYKKAEERRDELKGIRERIESSLSEEGCGSLSELEELIIKKRDEEKTLSEEFEKADYDRIIKNQQDMLSIARRFGDLHKAEDRILELEGEKEDRVRWENSANDGKRAEKVRALIEKGKSADNAYSDRVKEEEAVKSEAEEKKKALITATERLNEHAGKEKESEDLKTEKIRYESKRKDYEGLEDEVNELRQKKKEEERALEEEKKAKNDHEAFAEVIIKLQGDFETLSKEHEELLNRYIAGITGELAKKLEKGKPCPVCGSTEHPHKAEASEGGATEAQVDSKKKEADRKYKELQKQISGQEKARAVLEEKHRAAESVTSQVTAMTAKLDSRKENLIPGIDTSEALEREIERLRKNIEGYEKKKTELTEAEKSAKEAYTKANAGIDAAQKEREAAGSARDEAWKAVEKGIVDNELGSMENAEKLMLSQEEMDELLSCIADYDANLKTAKDNLEMLKEELSGKEEPDEEKCHEILSNADKAKGEYREKKAILSRDIERLERKVNELKTLGEGMEEKIREADEDCIFAKKLRGESGTGLQRYVLGIMFSSVVASANKMLEMVHGGRYRLFRSDDKAQGSNKRGLELKVYDRNSSEHEGRFVGTLSGGEKFLVSLALSIGLSTIAQRSGIRIEALFIDEGFGSLDDDSIGDAMSVLNSIQESNGMVGIISHVQLLQDQIPNKLMVEEDSRGSHIIQTIG